MNEMLARGRGVALVSLAVNGGLTIVKLVAGIVGHSYALIADAIESLGDIFSSAIVWGGLVIAAKPPDEDHPYGHGKAEPLAALAVAVMLVGAAIGIAWQAVVSIRTPHPSPAPFTLVVLIVVVVIKETMYRLESRTARRINSTAISIDAWHHRSDALSSAAAAVGITVALVGGPGYETADDWAALAACLVIVTNGLRFAGLSIHELMDTSPGRVLVDELQTVALKIEGARLVERALVRKTGQALYVDLHLEVDPALTVRRAHAIAHQVKEAIQARWPQVADVLVHVEPHGD